MGIREQIIETYPELENEVSLLSMGIALKDDADGSPIYIEHWTYSKPIPQGLKLGK